MTKKKKDPIRLTFKRPFPPGLNGDGGLMRMHWAEKKKVGIDIHWRIVDQLKKMEKSLTHFKGRKVGVRTMEFSCHPPDWDNHTARFKLVGDALKNMAFIDDDDYLTIREGGLKIRKVGKKADEVYVVDIYEIVEDEDPKEV